MSYKPFSVALNSCQVENFDSNCHRPASGWSWSSDYTFENATKTALAKNVAWPKIICEFLQLIKRKTSQIVRKILRLQVRHDGWWGISFSISIIISNSNSDNSISISITAWFRLAGNKNVFSFCWWITGKSYQFKHRTINSTLLETSFLFSLSKSMNVRPKIASFLKSPRNRKNVVRGHILVSIFYVRWLTQLLDLTG